PIAPTVVLISAVLCSWLPAQVSPAYLKASSPDASDYFGSKVAVSGDTMVIAAGSEDSAATGVNGDESDNSATSAGAAYVFVRSGSTWVQEAYLKASNTEALDLFGSSVAIDGETIVVGAMFEDSAAAGVNGDESDNSALSAGAAYVFVRSGSTWSQQAYLKASDPGINDNFGNAVAIDGDTILVGAFSDSAVGTDSGSAYVFTRTGSTWTQQAKLVAGNAGSGDLFGVSVAISGDTIAIGARREDSSATGVGGNQLDNSATDAGAVYVYHRLLSSWFEQGYLKAPNTQAGDEFGISVDVDGDLIVVGAWREDSSATTVNGDDSLNDASDAGAAYVFERSGGTWFSSDYLKDSQVDSLDLFGKSVSISGDYILVGSTLEDSGFTGWYAPRNELAASAGSAMLFVRSGSGWDRFHFKATNTDAGDNFGDHVAIDGTTVVAGAYNEDGGAPGVNGNQFDNSVSSAGAVYTFELCTEDPDDDLFGDNDDCSQAEMLFVTPIGTTPVLRRVFGAAAVHGKDEDYFIVNVPDGETVYVGIEFEHGYGDLDLYAYDVTGGCVTHDQTSQIVVSDSTTDNESVAIENNSGSAADILFVVDAYGSRFSCNDYRIYAAFCTDGDDDSLEDNDSCSTPVIAPLGVSTDLRLFGQDAAGGLDEDYYLVQVPNGFELEVDLEFVHVFGDIDLYAYSVASGACHDETNYLVRSISVTNHESILWVNDTGSTQDLYVVVDAYRPAGEFWVCNPYDMKVQVSPCVDDSFEDNDTRATAATLPLGLTEDLCVDLFDIDWWTITAFPGQTITVDALFTHSVGDIDLAMYQETGNPLLDAFPIQSAASSTDDEHLSRIVMGTSPKVFFVRVLFDDPGTATRNHYDLLVDRSYSAGCPGEGTPTITGTLSAGSPFTIDCPPLSEPCLGGLPPVIMFGDCSAIGPLTVPPPIGCDVCALVVNPSWGTLSDGVTVGAGLEPGFTFCVQCGCIATPSVGPLCINLSNGLTITIGD
ncbi:MAG: FG-GAP repeat protein, partial [Planctomycetes bacterium]|nr:FG-GAP repeat protein [Planctomycetota bacterium]